MCVCVCVCVGGGEGNEEECHKQSKDHQPLDTPEPTYNDHKTNQGLISYSVATSPMMYELAFGLTRTLFIRA